MRVFLDSADVDEIRKYSDVIDGVTTNPTLLREAVERRKGVKLKDYIAEICEASGKGRPVSLEVASLSAEKMVEEAELLYKAFNGIANNVVIKIPVSVSPFGDITEGIRAIREVSRRGIPVNATLIMTPSQALLAAKAGASYVSPFLGRVDDYIRDKLGIKYKKEDYYDAEAVRELKRAKAGSAKSYQETFTAYDAEKNEGITSGIDLLEKIKRTFENYSVKSEIIAASVRNVRQVFEAMLIGVPIVTVPPYVLEGMLKHPKTEEGVKRFYEDSEKSGYKELFENV